MFKRTRRPLAALLGVLAVGMVAKAQEDPADQIKYRQNTMKANGGHMGAIALILRHKVDHPTHLVLHARGLSDVAETLPDLFPEGSDMGDTRALAAIWEQSDKFQLAVQKSQEAVAAFTAAVEANDQEAIDKTFKEVGESCKGCHDDYRKEE